MTGEGDALLAALRDDPADDVGWLAYADWLQERADPRGDYLRLLLALGGGAVEPAQVEKAVRHLKKLRRPLDLGWVEMVVGCRAARPVRFRVFGVTLIGDDPPPDMFAYRKTVIHGALESGEFRQVMRLLLPVGEGRFEARAVHGIETFGKSSYETARAGDEPFVFAFMTIGHLKAVEPLAVLTEAT